MSKWKKGSLFEACELGYTAGCTALLIEINPEAEPSIRIAYEGGIFNPYSRWHPWRRRAWAAGFEAAQEEHDYRRKKSSSPEGEPVEEGEQGATS